MIGPARFGRLLDLGMAVPLVLLMGSQVTGRAAHEWLGLALFGMALAHQWLNRDWYARLPKGRYTARRAGASVLALLLAASMCLTVVTGILMSGHVAPALAASAGLNAIRRLHAAMSHWSFVLAALHFGLLWRRFTAPFTKTPGPPRRRVSVLRLIILLILVCCALRLFVPAQYPDYMLFRVSFVFLDYERPWLHVVLENVCRFVVLVWLMALCRGLGRKTNMNMP